MGFSITRGIVTRETFEEKAGRMFDYVESIEFRELQRRFYMVFNLILVVLVLGVIVLCGVDFQAHQELLRLRAASSCPH